MNKKRKRKERRIELSNYLKEEWMEERREGREGETDIVLVTRGKVRKRGGKGRGEGREGTGEERKRK